MPEEIKTPRVMNWSLQPRPRSPEQFISMMKVLTNFNGVLWWEKDENKDPINQIAVLNAINEHPDFSLVPKTENVFQGRTYVTMNPQTLGFIYITSGPTEGKQLMVTKAGYWAAEEENIQTLFIKQLLKWQYPSYAHGGPGGKGPKHFPLKNRWSIHPFLSTLEICRELEFINKIEMAIFILTMVTDNDTDKVIEEIVSYRKIIDTIRGARRKKEKRNSILKNKMMEVYQNEIDLNRYKK